MPTTLEGPDANVSVQESRAGRRQVRLDLADPDASHGGAAWETSYPLDLIEAVLSVKGRWVCDEIRRDEDPNYVQLSLRRSILGYVDKRAFAGRRVLDFGSGCGSSAICLSRLVDDVEVVGVELEREFVELASKRAQYHGLGNVSFYHSPQGGSLPDGLGEFDFIILSAVWEHLLPAERQSLLPDLWGWLNPGGVLFVNQLPHRYSLIERHTTGLPLINYLPDGLTRRAATSLSSHVEKHESWEELLRRGIRGGTATEILGILRSTRAEPMLMEPSRFGMSDRIDLWFELSSAGRWRALKRAMWAGFKSLKRITGDHVRPGAIAGDQEIAGKRHRGTATVKRTGSSSSSTSSRSGRSGTGSRSSRRCSSSASPR